MIVATAGIERTTTIVLGNCLSNCYELSLMFILDLDT